MMAMCRRQACRVLYKNALTGIWYYSIAKLLKDQLCMHAARVFSQSIHSPSTKYNWRLYLRFHG